MQKRIFNKKLVFFLVVITITTIISIIHIIPSTSSRYLSKENLPATMSIEKPIFTITLDNQGADITQGTSYIYEKYSIGFYLDSSATIQMTSSSNAITNPEKEGYTFQGYYTGMNGSGIQYIDENGNLTRSANLSNFTSNDTLYAYYIEIDKTLYNVLKTAAEEGIYATEYSGSHQDSMDVSKSTEKIYHYYAENDEDGTEILNKNNVIFAGHCWQMIRTTDTGGVKMIYNGEVENDQCLNTRGTHVGYAQRISQDLSSQYWYGTDYTYDSSTQEFKVSGTTEQAIWNENTGEGLVGKYTCMGANVDDTCSILYLVESYYNTTNAYVIRINSNLHYSQFGVLQFNADYNSPTYAGYMYGDVYAYDTTALTSSQSFTTTQTMLQSTSLNTTYWYASSVTWGTPVANRYNLDSPYQVSSTDDYPNLVGKYTLRNASQTYTRNTAYYIAGVNNSTMYYKLLQSGNLLSAYEPIIFGDSIRDNLDGTYSIDNPEPVYLKDWYTDYTNYKNKYTCNDSSGTCTNPRYTTATTKTNYTYVDASEKLMIGKTRSGTTLTDTRLVRLDELLKNSSNYKNYKYTCNTNSENCTEATLRMIISYTTTGYKYAPNHYYGSSVNLSGTDYMLVDPIGVENYNNLNNLSTHHYMCITEGLTSCDEVAYIYYIDSNNMYYIILRNGVRTASQALSNMLTKNITNSTIKTGVEAWYKHYLLNYDQYIEDTIFCNDRSIYALNGWDDNGGMPNAYLYFKENLSTSDLSCTNETDRFSVSNPNAPLTYKVGLMSLPEMKILNNNEVRKTGKYYWLSSPIYFSYYLVTGCRIGTNGGIGYSNVDYSAVGVRPAISLIPGIKYSTGNGRMDNPYKIN